MEGFYHLDYYTEDHHINSQKNHLINFALTKVQHFLSFKVKTEIYLEDLLHRIGIKLLEITIIIQKILMPGFFHLITK